MDSDFHKSLVLHWRETLRLDPDPTVAHWKGSVTKTMLRIINAMARTGQPWKDEFHAVTL